MINLNKLLNDMINTGRLIPGVQPKIAASLNDNDCIIKMNPEGILSASIVEDICMRLAKDFNINTPPFKLLKADNEYIFVIKRFDRIDNKKIAVEDFAQLTNTLAINKYKSSYEKCAQVIKKYSSNVDDDLLELFKRLVFSFIIGNSDMHLKNFSLIEENEGYRLSPAYDCISTNLLMPKDMEEMALSLNGKKRNLRLGDFLKLAYKIGIGPDKAKEIIFYLVSDPNKYFSLIKESMLTDEAKNSFISLINNRINRLV